MNDADMKELEKYRAKKKKLTEYNRKYQQDNYKRIICLIPKEEVDLFEQSRGDMPVSTYLLSLIHKDQKEKGLID